MKRKTIRRTVVVVLGTAVLAYILTPKKYEADDGVTYVVGPAVWNVADYGQNNAHKFFKYKSAFLRASVCDGMMFVNGLEYGRIERGDRVRISPFGRISVNGMTRKGIRPANQQMLGTASPPEI